MRKAERHTYIKQRARELAATGAYHNWHGIEAVLRFKEGWHEARDVLDSDFLREELDVICGDTFLVPSWERPRPW